MKHVNYQVMKAVLGALGQENYSGHWITLAAKNAGSPMHRQRWFMLAKHHSVSPDELASVKARIAPLTREEWKARIAFQGDVSHTQSRLTRNSTFMLSPQERVARQWNPSASQPMETWLLHAKAEDTEARLRMLGNCVVPDMAEVAFRLLFHAF